MVVATVFKITEDKIEYIARAALWAEYRESAVKFRHNSHYGESPNAYPLRTKSLFLGKRRKNSTVRRLFFTCAFLHTIFIFLEVIMKKTTISFFKRAFSLLLATVALCGAILLVSCQSESLVINDSDTCVVINVSEKALEGKEEMLLIDYMAFLQEKGELDYTVSNGMVTAINNIENPSDFSKCWMLYTSDVDNSSSAWGTVEYDGQTYGSAIVGAEALKIKANCLYIWVFKAFD